MSGSVHEHHESIRNADLDSVKRDERETQYIAHWYMYSRMTMNNRTVTRFQTTVVVSLSRRVGVRSLRGVSG